MPLTPEAALHMVEMTRTHVDIPVRFRMCAPHMQLYFPGGTERAEEASADRLPGIRKVIRRAAFIHFAPCFLFGVRAENTRRARAAFLRRGKQFRLVASQQ